ncbi:MAG: DUF2244 domain-containing protein [Rhodobacteraceae bacterium]|jgi:uncharacterized membrane protein|nr:DUF2244 domain-containing protein [Paracoccaceae bacterium]
MPYHWTHPEAAGPDTPLARLTLWPHQSMTAGGFVAFIGVTAGMLAIPLIAMLGSPIAWVLMLFFLAAIAGVWWAIMVNRSQQSRHEELAIWPDRMRLAHVVPKRAPLEWEANPFWVRVNLREEGGPVEKYLTLTGADREVELGAFLSPEEREALHGELTSLLARLR